MGASSIDFSHALFTSNLFSSCVQLCAMVNGVVSYNNRFITRMRAACSSYHDVSAAAKEPTELS